LRAPSVALENGLPVAELRRTWGIVDGSIHGPWWVVTFNHYWEFSERDRELDSTEWKLPPGIKMGA
jgi:hypothetical protein